MVLNRDYSVPAIRQLTSVEKHLDRETKGEKKKENSEMWEKKGEIGVCWQ